MTNLAPISITVYTRLEHFKKCIESLQKNTLASQSILYIFSDAPKQGDEEKVALVRAYAKKITGFLEVRLIEQSTNSYKKNIEDSRQIPLNAYGKMIKLEDDNIVSPYFLEFLNNGLEFYKNDERIVSIAGYCPPIGIPDSFKDDVFVLNTFDAWGYGTWKEKFFKHLKPIDEEAYLTYMKNNQFVEELKKNAGNIFINLINAEYRGEIDAGDVKMLFWQNVNNSFTIYPKESLVQNIGNDGSGYHCGITTQYDIILSNKKVFKFIKNIKPSSIICKLNSIFYS